GTPKEDRKPYQFRAALQRLQDRFKALPEIQERLEELDEDEVQKRFELEDSFDAAVGDALELLDQHELQRSRESSISHSPAPATPPTVVNNLPRRPRLPEIKVPDFDGAIEEFPTFWDAYTSVIHDNTDLEVVQKFQYLRGLLKGRAAAVISSLATTEENYTTAIDILKKKYDCKKKILRRHWAILRDYPPLQRDSPTELGKLADVMNQHIQALETLGQKVTSWDLPLTDLITQKLAQETI
ncbi:uncharacterized protein LOC107047490, partial [Diachasma alloeum]|uniref:uncharacterized protein LOC107047490 n=1 Tax=Diachasma alloeum TaxID=454923 RepID=UPI0007381847